MKCVLCGIEEHDSWSGMFIPTVDKRIHLSFIVCGDCISLDTEVIIPPGKYREVEMQVLDV